MAQFSLLAMLSLEFPAPLAMFTLRSQRTFFLTLPRSHHVLTFVFFQAMGSAFCPLVLVEISGLAKVGWWLYPQCSLWYHDHLHLFSVECVVLCPRAGSISGGVCPLRMMLAC